MAVHRGGFSQWSGMGQSVLPHPTIADLLLRIVGCISELIDRSEQSENKSHIVDLRGPPRKPGQREPPIVSANAQNDSGSSGPAFEISRSLCIEVIS